jgi:hypothetical protein
MTDRGGYYVEYAKSGRSSCKFCGRSIAQGVVRIGWETKSTIHDGWDMGWYHLKCCRYDGTPDFSALTDLKGAQGRKVFFPVTAFCCSSENFFLTFVGPPQDGSFCDGTTRMRQGTSSVKHMMRRVRVRNGASARTASCGR